MAGRRLGALEGGYPPLLPMHPWWGGMKADKKVVYLKWASHFSLSIQNFIFFPEEHFGGFGWVVWHGGGGQTPPPFPPPVDKHIPGLVSQDVGWGRHCWPFSSPANLLQQVDVPATTPHELLSLCGPFPRPPEVPVVNDSGYCVLRHAGPRMCFLVGYPPQWGLRAFRTSWGWVVQPTHPLHGGGLFLVLWGHARMCGVQKKYRGTCVCSICGGADGAAYAQLLSP